jgi:hypothetical protein
MKKILLSSLVLFAFSSSCYGESYEGVISAIGEGVAKSITAYKDPEGQTRKEYNNVTTINSSEITNGAAIHSNMGNKISGKDVKATNVYMKNRSKLTNGIAYESNMGNDL